MDTIENKITKLVLETGQFEKAADSAIKTLGRLNSALELKGSVKSFDEVERAASKINFDSLNNALDTINQRFSAMGVAGMTAISRITNGVIDLGKKLGSSLMRPLNQITNQIKTGGWKRASDIAQAKFQIEGLNKDWEALKQNINDAVDQTSYGFNEAALVASQFSATGLEAGQKMYEYLRGVAGVAAMTNSTYSDIGHIFTTISGQGKLMTEQLNQFAGRGLNVAAELGKQLGKTEAEIRKMTTDGEISFATFAQAMYDAYGTQAAKANETFTGSLANMKAALSRIGQPFAESIQKYMVPVFNKLREFINNIKKSIEKAKIYEYFDGIMKAVTKLVEHIIDKIDLTFLDEILSRAEDIYKVIEKVLGKATEAVDWVADKFSGIRKKVKKDSKELVENVETTAEKIEELAKAVIHGDYGNGEERRNKLADMYEKVQNKVNELMGNSFRYAEATEEVVEANEEVAESLEKVYTNAGLTEEEIDELAKAVIHGDYGNGEERVEKLGDKYGIVQNKVNELLGCSYRYKIVQDEVNDSMKEAAEAADVVQGKLTFYTSGIRYLVDTLVTHAKSLVEILKSKFMDEKTRGKINDIVSGLSAVVDIVAHLVGTVLNASFEPFVGMLELLGDGTLDILSTIGLAFQKLYVWLDKHDVYNKLFMTVGHAGSFALSILKKMDKAIRWFLNPNTWNSVTKVIVDIKDNIVEFFKAFKETKAFRKMKAELRKFGHDLKTLKETILDRITKWFQDLSKKEIKLPEFDAKKFAESVSEKIMWIYDKIMFIKKAIAGVFGNKGSEAEGTGLTIFERIKRFFSDFSFSDTVNDFIETLKKVKEAVFGFFKPKEGVSTTSNLKTSAAGKTVESIKTFVQSVKSSVEDFSSGKISSFGDFIEKLREHIGNFIAKLKEYWPQFNVVWDNIVTIVKGVTLISVLKSVRKIGSSFADFTKNIADIVPSFKSIFESVSGAIDNFGNIFKSVSTAVDTLATSYAGLLKAKQRNENASAFLKSMIALSVLVAAFAVSVALLGKLDDDQLTKGLVAVSVIAGLVTMLVGVYNTTKKLPTVSDKGASIGDAIKGIFGDLNKPLKKFLGKLGTTALLASFAAAVVSLGIVLKVLSKIPLADGIKALGFMGVMFLMMVGVLKTLDAMSSEKAMAGVSGFMLAFAVSIKLLAGVVKSLSKMPFDKALKGILLLTVLLGEMVGVLYLAPNDKKTKGLGAFMLAFAVSVKLLVGAIKSLTKVPLDKGIKAVILLGLLFGELVLVLRLTPSERKTKGLGAFLMAFAVAVRLLVSSIKALGKIKRSELKQGIGALTKITVLIETLMLVSKVGKNSKSSILDLIGIIGLVLSVTHSLKALSKIDARKLDSAVDALTDVFRSFSGFVFWLGGGPFGKKGDPANELIEVLGIMAILTEVVWAFEELQTVDPVQMEITADSIAKVFNAISKLIHNANVGMSDIHLKLGKKISYDKEAADNWLTVAVNYLGAGGLLFETYWILKQMDESQLDPDDMEKRATALAKATTGLGILIAAVGQLGSAAGVGTVVSKKDKNGNVIEETITPFKALLDSGLAQVITSGAIVALITAIAGIIGAIRRNFPDWKGFEDVALGFQTIGEAIGSFLGGIISGALKPIIGQLPQFAKEINAFISELGSLVTVIGDADTSDFDTVLDKIQDIKDLMDNLKDISWDEFKIAVLDGLTRLFDEVEVDATGKEISRTSALTKNKDALIRFIEEMGELQTKFDTELGDTNPTEKIEVLRDMLAALADVGFEKFWTNVAAVFGNMADVEQEYDKNKGRSVQVLKDFNTTNIGMMMTNLGEFIDNYKTFAETHLVNLPEPEEGYEAKLQGLLTVMTYLSSIGWKEFTANVTSKLAGKGTSLRKGMTYLGQFIEKFATFFEPKLEKLYALTDVENKLDTLKTVMKKLGEIGWTEFKDNVINAINEFFFGSEDAMSTVIDGTGNMYQTKKADSSMERVITDLSSLVDQLVIFEKDHLANLDEDGSLVTKTDILAQVLEKLNAVTPKTGGLLQWIFGEQDIAHYGANLEEFGLSLVRFNTIVTGTDFSEALAVTDTLVQFAENFDKLVNENNGLFNAGTTATALDSFGTIVSAWFTTIATAVDTNSKILLDIGKTIFDYIVLGFATAGETMNQVLNNDNIEEMMLKPIELSDTVQEAFNKLNSVPGTESVKGANHFVIYLIKSLTGEEAKKKLEAAAKDLVDIINSAIKDSVDKKEATSESVKRKLALAIANVFDHVKPYAEAFETIGKYIMEGLERGIRNHENLPINAAIDAAKKTVQAASDTTGVESPSTEFMEIGMYCMKGLAMGFTDNANLPESAIRKVATDSVDAMTNTIADVESAAVDSSTDFMNSLQSIYDYINYIINSSVDTVPRITPVMDLSSIQNGSYMMNKMMGANGYAFNLGNMQMNAMFSNLSIPQNDNQLIVDSINQLRADMDNLSNAILERPIVLNDGTLVGKMAPRMSTELRLLYSRSR